MREDPRLNVTPGTRAVWTANLLELADASARAGSELNAIEDALEDVADDDTGPRATKLRDPRDLGPRVARLILQEPLLQEPLLADPPPDGQLWRMNARLSHGAGSHRLEVANFGPVSKAELELRPLTVFAGPSNAGKSCLAKLVYALHGYFSRHPVARTRTYRLSDFNRAVRRIGDLPGVARRLEEFVLNPVEERVDSSALGEDIAALTRLALQVPDVGADTADPLLDVFGTASMDDLILRRARDCRFRLSYAAADASERAEAFQYAFKIVDGELDCTVAIPSDASLRLEKGRLFRRVGRGSGLLFWPADDDDESIGHGGLLITLVSLAQPGTVGSLSRPAWYLPAGRSGIIEAQAAILGSAIDRMGDNGPRNHGPVPGALREFLRDIFVDLPRRPVGSRVGETLARRFEETIIEGTVCLEARGDASSVIAFRPDGWDRDLPLGQASSLTTQMIPLVLYLRHYATPGSTIIIEEPEAHMHPAMQVRFMTAIARIVAAGVRVLMTTHSEWILSALANIVRASELSDRRQEDLAAGAVLERASVGAWLFEPGDLGIKTSEIPLNSESGMYDAGFPDVSRALYNNWATIDSRLQED